MFCVATTPTPARVWAQRAATAGLEEDTAMPSMWVRGQRPRIEKVMIPIHPLGFGLSSGSPALHAPAANGARLDEAEDDALDRKADCHHGEKACEDGGRVEGV